MIASVGNDYKGTKYFRQSYPRLFMTLQININKLNCDATGITTLKQNKEHTGEIITKCHVFSHITHAQKEHAPFWEVPKKE